MLGSAVIRGPTPVEFIPPDRTGEVSVAAFELSEQDEALADRLPLGPSGVAPANPRRAAQFLAGRYACERSLGAFGDAASCTVGRNVDGSPSWPAGFVGSVTHGGGLAAAVTARRSRYASLGIDAESVFAPDTEAEIRSIVASPEELARLSSFGDPRLLPALLTLVFSAKESLFKCLYPLVGEPFGFDHAELAAATLARDGTGDFAVRLLRPLGDRFPAGGVYRGRFAIVRRSVQTAVALRAHGWLQARSPASGSRRGLIEA